MGRPKKRTSEFSLKFVGQEMEKILAQEIIFLTNPFNLSSKKKIENLKAGEIVLLENLRFYKGELNDDLSFAKRLAELGDIFVNDAFAVSHRQQASVHNISKFIPSFAGLLMQKEIKYLSKLLKNPLQPYVVLLGGVKLATKVKLIENLLPKVNKILIGGAMANVFLKAKGLEIGKSFLDEREIKDAKNFLKSEKIILPDDFLTSLSLDFADNLKMKDFDKIQEEEIILDIGPKTILKYSEILKKAKTILWNGPMGKIEIKEFTYGSLMLGRLIASLSSGKAFTVCGGGETVEILKKTKMFFYIDFISTGGGAMLNFLSGNEMPGLKYLKE